MALLFGAPFHARADLYHVTELGNTYANDMIGITSSGDVVIHYLYRNDVCAGSLPCWGTFSEDGSVAYSAVAPAVTYDNGGAACNNSSLPIAVDDPAVMVCNDGRVAFTYAGHWQLWTAPDPANGPLSVGDITLLFQGSAGPVFMNARGDVAFSNGYTNFVAYDLGPTPAPEPSSLLLLATGAIGVAGSLRRRLA